MVKKIKTDPKDLAIFYEAMKGSKILTQNKIRIAPQNKKSFSKSRPISLGMTPTSPPPLLTSDESIDYKQVNVSDKTLRYLSKGQYTVDAILDLHGMTVINAKQQVLKFLQQCLQKKLKIALIIHGKGKGQHPILKNELNHWLREINAVLAFCSATPKHGSLGAIYILLRVESVL